MQVEPVPLKYVVQEAVKRWFDDTLQEAQRGEGRARMHLTMVTHMQPMRVLRAWLFHFGMCVASTSSSGRVSSANRQINVMQ